MPKASLQDEWLQDDLLQDEWRTNQDASVDAFDWALSLRYAHHFKDGACFGKKPSKYVEGIAGSVSWHSASTSLVARRVFHPQLFVLPLVHWHDFFVVVIVCLSTLASFFRGSEGGLVVYGAFVFFDVDWLAKVLKPLLAEKSVSSDGHLFLGGKEVHSSTSLRKFEDEGILEPGLAKELWGEEAAPHVLGTLESAGLTFPRAGDTRAGLVVLLRLPKDRPRRVGIKIQEFLENKTEEEDGQIKAACTFYGGVPPGFIERLLTRCCHLGTCDPFWRFGVLIQSEPEELFSVILQYNETESVGKLILEAFGDCTTPEPWAAMSACLSVVVQMLSEFPGMNAAAEM